MSKIVYYKHSTDLFDIQEWGGISYYIINKNECNVKMLKNECLSNSTYSSDWETCTTENIVLSNKSIKNIIYKVNNGLSILRSLEDFKQSLYVKNTDSGNVTFKAGDVAIMRGDTIIGYRGLKELFTTVNIDKYKCVVNVMTGGCLTPDNTGRVLGITKLSINKPYQVPKGSFIILKIFNTDTECQSFVSYCNTKLINFLYIVGACGSTLTKEFFRFVPDPQDWSVIYEDRALPGYTPDEDGIYEDKEGKKHCSLYAKYKLSGDEIKIIESVIKERK